MDEIIIVGPMEFADNLSLDVLNRIFERYGIAHVFGDRVCIDIVYDR